ncbi:MAG: helix-turn-helix domain-containing protein [Enterococcus sp.]
MDKLILALFKPQDKLKVSTLYQLLSGKRTMAVLTYGYFYDCLHLVGLLKKLSQTDYQKNIQQLIDKNLLLEEAGYLWLSELGQQQQEQKLIEYLATIEMYRYGRNSQEMWRMVQFLVQVTSNFGRQKQYIPLETAPQYTEKLRQLVRHYQTELPELVYQELVAVFNQIAPVQADFLAATFSGYDYEGQVPYQLFAANISNIEQHLFLLSSTHQFFQQIDWQSNSVLTQSLTPFLIRNQNQSMQASRALFLQGASVTDVMRVRRLKEGTVVDHLLEWALSDASFPFATYLPATIITQCQQLAGDFRYWKYQEIQERFPIKFWEFRLFQIWQKRGG